MDLNFKEALAALSGAFPAYLFYAAALVFGGLLILLEFGLVLVLLHLARITASAAAPILAASILLGGWLTILAWQRFFLYRRRALMLAMFAGMAPAQAGSEVRRFFPAYPSWARWNRRARQAFVGSGGESEPAAIATPGIFRWRAEAAFSAAIFSLAFARGGEPAAAIREGVALYWRHGNQARRLMRSWSAFSLAGLALLFLFLALANWFIFSSAGAPPALGLVLALVIAWTLHQAFISPLALAGVSAALLAETKGHEPDAALCEKLAPLLTS
ncbi:MAG: hypothetical protein MUC72_00075 [Acidobacteria bacterium]|jgi:hypothetical protein|nr:hypothetical protein [Acidobacteriota bacterium]